MGALASSQEAGRGRHAFLLAAPLAAALFLAPAPPTPALTLLGARHTHTPRAQDKYAKGYYPDSLSGEQKEVRQGRRCRARQPHWPAP